MRGVAVQETAVSITMSLSSPCGSVNQHDTMVTSVYTFPSTWAKHKSVRHSHSMPHVGYPGLTLTPIQESSLSDSMLDEARAHEDDDQCENNYETTTTAWPATNGSLPGHWLLGGLPPDKGSSGDAAMTKASKDSSSSSSSLNSKSMMCCLKLDTVQASTFLPKDEPMTLEQKRAHLCKLLLFALCGFVIVAGIVFWVFSSSFS